MGVSAMRLLVTGGALVVRKVWEARVLAMRGSKDSCGEEARVKVSVHQRSQS
jgi:hypothetical protein